MVELLCCDSLRRLFLAMKTAILSPQPAGSSAIRERGSAFTLVEILVVIAIVAFLTLNLFLLQGLRII